MLHDCRKQQKTGTVFLIRCQLSKICPNTRVIVAHLTIHSDLLSILVYLLSKPEETIELSLIVHDKTTINTQL